MARDETTHIADVLDFAATEVERLEAVNADLLAALKAVLTVWHDATATRIDDDVAETAARAAIAKAEPS
jgi:hypothetical protein